MKKATMVKKLDLSKETLHRLDNQQLVQAAGGSGGGWSDTSVCPSTTNHCP